jgi:hypothetical protein
MDTADRKDYLNSMCKNDSAQRHPEEHMVQKGKL